MATRIAVFGLGYVGTVSAACFAARGHQVMGVDIDEAKTDALKNGRSPILEERIGEVIAEGVEAGRLTATTEPAHAVAETDLALVCVGTPSAPNGGLFTGALERAAHEIGEAMRQRSEPYLVTIRSTMVPGTTEEVVIPALERASGMRAGRDFGVCVNPEFLREGSSVRDFFDPPKTVIGEVEPGAGDLVAELYEGLPGPVFRVPLRVAEMVKYVDNSFHALKIGFANEIGTVCKELGLDSHDVMSIFMADTKLNISTAYLRPGYAFGGSCLPKDLRALVHVARHADLSLPILESILPSNEAQIQRAFDLVTAGGQRKVGLFGLAFKSGTDDLRESPMVQLAERLLGRGLDLRIYDAQVALSHIRGANRAYVEARIPHLSQCMSASADEVAAHGEVCVVATGDPAAAEAIRRAEPKLVLDLDRGPSSSTLAGTPGYVGFNW